jgi:hypothetical protein
LAYALTGRKVTTYHMFSANDPELAVINEEIGEALPGSTVCSIAKERHVDFILDFGSSYLANAEGAQQFMGVVDVKPSPSVQVADSQSRFLRLGSKSHLEQWHTTAGPELPSPAFQLRLLQLLRSQFLKISAGRKATFATVSTDQS